MNLDRVMDVRERLSADRERLLAMRAELRAQENALLAEHENLEDRSNSERTANLMESVGELEHAMVKKIDAALARIEAGSYGICSTCGCAIEPQRLQVRPEAESCSDCFNG